MVRRIEFVHYLFWFFHILGLAVWFGSLLFMGICLPLLKRGGLGKEIRHLLNRIRRVMTLVGNIAAAVMLVSGGLLLGTQPSGHGSSLWVQLMTQIGGATILFSIIALTWQGRNVANRLANEGATDTQVQASTNVYQVFLWVIVAAIVVVLGIVSARV